MARNWEKAFLAPFENAFSLKRQSSIAQIGLRN
jgi:hypothetical protein